MTFTIIAIIVVTVAWIAFVIRNNQTYTSRMELIDDFHSNNHKIIDEIFRLYTSKVAVTKLAKINRDFDNYHISYNEQLLQPWKNPIKKPYPKLEDYL